MKPHVVEKLAEFIEGDNEDEVLDDRTKPKLKVKKKPKELKLKERADRRRKLMREVLEEQKNEENNNRLQEEDSYQEDSEKIEPVDSLEIAKKTFKMSKKQRKVKKAKKLDILRNVYRGLIISANNFLSFLIVKFSRKGNIFPYDTRSDSYYP